MIKLCLLLIILVLIGNPSCAQKKIKVKSVDKPLKCKLNAITYKNDSTRIFSRSIPVSFTVIAEKINYILPLTINGYRTSCSEIFNHYKLAVTAINIRLIGNSSTYEYILERETLNQWTITVTIDANMQQSPQKKLLIGDKVPYFHPLFQRLLELYGESNIEKMKPLSPPKEYKLITYNPLNFEWIFCL